jgi:hypothetical protein
MLLSLIYTFYIVTSYCIENCLYQPTDRISDRTRSTPPENTRKSIVSKRYSAHTLSLYFYPFSSDPDLFSPLPDYFLRNHTHFYRQRRSSIIAISLHQGEVNTLVDRLPRYQTLAKIFCGLFYKKWDQGEYNSAFATASPVSRDS